MNGKVDGAGKQRFFDLFGEHSFRVDLGADLGERYVPDDIAGGLDDLDASLVTGLLQTRFDPASLPQREL